MGYIPDWQRQSAAKNSSRSGAAKEPTKFGVVSKPIFHGANQQHSNAKQTPFSRHYADGGDVEAADKAEGLALSNADREAATANMGTLDKLKQGVSDTWQRLKDGNIDDRSSAAYWKYGAGRAETERDTKMRSANEAAGAANRGDNTSEWDAGRRPMTDFHYGKTKDAFSSPSGETSGVKLGTVDTSPVTEVRKLEDKPAAKAPAKKKPMADSLDAPAAKVTPVATQSFPYKSDAPTQTTPVESKQALDPTPSDVRRTPPAPQESTTKDFRAGRGAVKVDSFFGVSRNRAGQVVDDDPSPKRDPTKDKRWYEMLVKKGASLTDREKNEARAAGVKVDD